MYPNVLVRENALERSSAITTLHRLGILDDERSQLVPDLRGIPRAIPRGGLARGREVRPPNIGLSALWHS